MVIGLIGKAQSGKTTVGNHLINKYNFTKFSFADPLKEMLINAGLITYNEAYVEKTPRSRELLQKIGTNIFREQVEYDYWIKAAQKRIRILFEDGFNNIVIDDIRFPNEADLVKGYNGFLIKMEREDFIDTTAGTIHPSESLVDSIKSDYVIRAKSGEIDKILKGVDIIMSEVNHE